MKSVKVQKIQTHEEIIEENLKEVVASIKKEGLKNPVIIDKESKVLLDGHHRLESFKILGLREIPVIEVDYSSSRVGLKSRRDFELTKEEVIEVGKSDYDFPAKTTEHSFKDLEKAISS